MSNSAFAFGLGVGTQNSKGEWLEIFFPQPTLNPSEQLAGVATGFDSNATLSQDQLRELQQSLAAAGESEQAALAERLGDSGRPAVAVLLREDAAPVSYTHLTLPTTIGWCRSRWAPYH